MGNITDVNIPIVFEEFLLFPVYIWIGLLRSVSLVVIAIRMAGNASWLVSTVISLLATATPMTFYVPFVR